MNDSYEIGKINGKKAVSIKCTICNNRFEVRKQTFHSVRPYRCKSCSCSGERNIAYGKGYKISGKNNGNFGGLSENHKKNISKSKIGIKMNISPELREKKRIIGRNTLIKWMTENPEKFKESSRKGGINSLKLQSEYGRISSIEQKTMDWLSLHNIEYEFQFSIEYKFLYDFKIGNVIVEVNGIWFHNLPKQKEKDIKKRIFAESKGYNVIYLWEDEVNRNDFSKLKELFL